MRTFMHHQDDMWCWLRLMTQPPTSKGCTKLGSQPHNVASQQGPSYHMAGHQARPTPHQPSSQSCKSRSKARSKRHIKRQHTDTPAQCVHAARCAQSPHDKTRPALQPRPCPSGHRGAATLKSKASLLFSHLSLHLGLAPVPQSHLACS